MLMTLWVQTGYCMRYHGLLRYVLLLQGSSILQAAPAVHRGPGRLNGGSSTGAAAFNLGPDSSAAQNGTTPADSGTAGASTAGPAAKRWGMLLTSAARLHSCQGAGNRLGLGLIKACIIL